MDDAPDVQPCPSEMEAVLSSYLRIRSVICVDKLRWPLACRADSLSPPVHTTRVMAPKPGGCPHLDPPRGALATERPRQARPRTCSQTLIRSPKRRWALTTAFSD